MSHLTQRSNFKPVTPQKGNVLLDQKALQVHQGPEPELALSAKRTVPLEMRGMPRAGSGTRASGLLCCHSLCKGAALRRVQREEG